MLGNVATMVLVLGGTAVCAFVLLYFSLRTGAPGRKKLSAEPTAAVIAANSGSDSPDR
jgi:hypothetical protein